MCCCSISLSVDEVSLRVDMLNLMRQILAKIEALPESPLAAKKTSLRNHVRALRNRLREAREGEDLYLVRLDVTALADEMGLNSSSLPLYVTSQEEPPSEPEPALR